MSDRKNDRPIIGYISNAGHAEMLKKSASPAGHAEAFAPVNQQPQAAAPSSAPAAAPTPAQGGNAASTDKSK